MKIRQSKLATFALVVLTLLFALFPIQIELERHLFSELLVEPSLVSIEMCLFLIALPIISGFFALSSSRVLIVKQDMIILESPFGVAKIPIEQIVWISSGKGWLYIEDAAGTRLSFKIFFGHKRLNKKPVFDLESCMIPLKDKVRLIFPERTQTVILKGVFARIVPTLIAVFLVLSVLWAVAIWSSKLDLIDALIVAFVVPVAALIGFTIPIYLIGTLVKVELSRDSIDLFFPLKRIKFENIKGEPKYFWLVGNQIVTTDGKKQSIRGLTVIGSEKLDILREKWFRDGENERVD